MKASAAAGVTDERVLRAIGDVDRAAYSPTGTLAVYVDSPIRIAHDQVTTQPSLVARMVEALELTGDERVLEVGTGLGYQAAVLGRLARELWTVERFADLAEAARENLVAQRVTNVHVVAGDGTAGLAEHAPYDAIVVAAAFPTVPPPLVDQLVEGGRLVQPIGPGGAEDVVAFVKRKGRLVEDRFVTAARFVPLVGAHGYPVEPG